MKRKLNKSRKNVNKIKQKPKFRRIKYRKKFKMNQ